MEATARDGIAVDDAGRKEGRRTDEEEPCRKDHGPVGEAALHDRAGQAGTVGHVRYRLPLVFRPRYR